MAEIPELNASYLLNMIKNLRSLKKKFFRAYPFYCQGKISYHPFLEQYAIPLVNMKVKINTFKEYFTDLNVKYPKLPELEGGEIDQAVLYWYAKETIVEDFIYKGEKIDVEFDQNINLFDEYWQNEFWLAA